MLLQSLAKHWWVLLLRGILAVLFGISAFAWPGLTLATLVMLFAAFALVDGVFAVIGAISGRRENEDWLLLLIWGIVGILAGLLTWHKPGLTALVLVLYMGAWAIAKGVVEIATAVRLRKVIEGEWALILCGLLSVAFGLMIFWDPEPGAIALVWILGGYALAFGLVLVFLSFKVKGLGGLSRA
jgi:uncharacterized membrane protein HdeD (DUF308 family)